ncbi:hypothetical protein KY389_15080, partial [Paracoccus bogoriensis]|nr:hypothetical protein [Paracoccus bogoriensis]
MTHKARDHLVRQQTRIVHAVRAHPGEFGIVVPKGIHRGIHDVERLIMACEQAGPPHSPSASNPWRLDGSSRKALNLLADQLIGTLKTIDELTADIRADARANEDAQRLQTIPGIGPVTAGALVS